MDLTPYGGFPRHLASTPIPVTAGERYEVGGWVTGPGRIALEVHFGSAYAPANLTQAWSSPALYGQVSYEVVVPYGASALTLVLRPPAAYGALVDDLRVVEPADLGERLPNGRFEVGIGVEPDGWDLSCTTGSTSWTQASGANGRLVSMTTAGNGTLCRIGHVASSPAYAAVSPGRKYRFSPDLHAGDDVRGDANLTFHAPGGPDETHVISIFIVAPSPAWHAEWLEACAPSGAAYASVRVTQETRSTDSEARWDNLSVRDVGAC